MPAPVRSPALASVGLIVIALLCVQLLRNAVTLEAAAQRALLTVVVLAVVDRIAVPAGRAMLSAAPRSPEPDQEPADADAPMERPDRADRRVT